jgi:hypothetical protein
MPRPRKGESKKAYISRAISYMVRVEGLEQKHAVAKSYNMWRQHKKKGKK